MGSPGFSKFKGAVAVVTGGSSGIGRSIAEALLARGSNVVICARDAEKTGRVAREIGAVGVPVDVADASSVNALAERVLNQFGKVNILCNNAGVGPSARMQDMSLVDWRWMLDVNLWGVIHGVTSFLPHLLANPEGGHVVNTSSLAGLWSVPGLGAYSVAKSGVVALTETLHQELNSSSELVGATVFCPGPVRTDIGSSLRGRPAEETGALTEFRVEERFPPEAFLATQRCGELVVGAIERNHLYLMTHPAMGARVTERCEALIAAFARAKAGGA